MRTCLIGTIAVLAVGLGSASAQAQTAPRDKPDARAVDSAKVATVEQWSKRRGSKVIWGQDPQPQSNSTGADSASRIDAEKVDTVDRRSAERGHRQVWFKYPEKRQSAVAANDSKATTGTSARSSAVAAPKSAKPRKDRTVGSAGNP